MFTLFRVYVWWQCWWQWRTCNLSGLSTPPGYTLNFRTNFRAVVCLVFSFNIEKQNNRQTSRLKPSTESSPIITSPLSCVIKYFYYASIYLVFQSSQLLNLSNYWNLNSIKFTRCYVHLLHNILSSVYILLSSI